MSHFESDEEGLVIGNVNLKLRGYSPDSMEMRSYDNPDPMVSIYSKGLVSPRPGTGGPGSLDGSWNGRETMMGKLTSPQPTGSNIGEEYEMGLIKRPHYLTVRFLQYPRIVYLTQSTLTLVFVDLIMNFTSIISPFIFVFPQEGIQCTPEEFIIEKHKWTILGCLIGFPYRIRYFFHRIFSVVREWIKPPDLYDPDS